MTKSPEDLSKLDRKLDLILKLLAIDKLYGKKLIDQVEILDHFGIEAPEIATILGTSGDNVRAQRSKLKKRQEEAAK
jgi:hypothetical protein